LGTGHEKSGDKKERQNTTQTRGFHGRNLLYERAPASYHSEKKDTRIWENQKIPYFRDFLFF
jgi:hypothetical protein